jgi:hypothetical protein
VVLPLPPFWDVMRIFFMNYCFHSDHITLFHESRI